MEDKKAYEAFRVRQFASPHPALQHIQAADAGQGHSCSTGQPDGAATVLASTDPLHINLVPDHERVIIHFDVDSFYAQVEECRNPSLRGQPLAVTQKYLVVTANYPARAAGVTKLMGITDARKACPGLILVPGEDLTPYRCASRDIRAVLSRWGVAEKLGMDEIWVDITQEVERRLGTVQISSSIHDAPWCGHLVTAGLQLTAHSRHRPMDLRVVPQGPAQQETDEPQPAATFDHQHQAITGAGAHVRSAGVQGTTVQPASDAEAGEAGSPGDVAVHSDSPDSQQPAWLPGCVLRLKLGAVVAAEMRQAVKQETGLRCSAGIACSKLLTKLVSGLHKPDDQTIILPTQAQAFVAPLPVRALPGVGYKAEQLLKSWDVVTAADARRISKHRLVQGLGEKHGSSLFHACRGVDTSAVVASGPPKSITVEDSFKSCSSWQGVATVLQVLVPDLLDRLQEDAQEFPELDRRPSTLSVKWRKAGTGWARSSASTPWPPAAHPATATAATAAGSNGGQVAALIAGATGLLKQHLSGSGWSLTLLNIGAAGFKTKPSHSASGGIQQFLVAKPPSASTSTAATAATAAATATAAAVAPAASDGIGVIAAATQSAPTALAVSPTNQPHLLQDLLQVAKAATAARRDYSRPGGGSGSNGGGSTWPVQLPYVQQHDGRCVPKQAAGQPERAVGVLSKRQERQLWELAMQQQQQLKGPLNQSTPPIHASHLPQQVSAPQQQQQTTTRHHASRQGSSNVGVVTGSHTLQQSVDFGTSWVATNLQQPHQLHAQQQHKHTHHNTWQQQEQQPAAPTGQPGQQVLHHASRLDAPSIWASAPGCGSPGAVSAKRRCLPSRGDHPTSCQFDGHQPPVTGADVAAEAGGGAGAAGGCSAVGADMSVLSCCCTNLHSVEGWGLMTCDVLEGFDDMEADEGAELLGSLPVSD